MCAKRTKFTPQKVVKMAKTPNGKPSSNAESDDQSQSTNRSLRSSGRRRGQSSSSSFSKPESRPGSSQSPSNTDRASNLSHSHANTSHGRISRKQPKSTRRKDHALSEIRKFQMSSELLMRKVPFQRIVREIMQKYGEYRIQSLALQALQESAEFFLVRMFEDSVLCCFHRKCITVGHCGRCKKQLNNS